MRHLATAAVLAGLLLPTTVSGQGASKIVIGDGVTSQGSSPAYTGGSQVPFTNAMAALASGGPGSGTIEVLPGTYLFARTIEVKKPGVRITGGPNARIVPRLAFGGACFEVQADADGFVLDGPTLEDHRDAPPAPVAFLDVKAPRFTMTNCRVAVSSADPASPVSFAVLIQGSSGAELHGALLEGNVFVAGRLDGEDAKVDAYGRVFVRSEHGRGLRVLGNAFVSAAAPQVKESIRLRNAISLQDEEYTSITGNTFNSISSPDEGDPEVFGLVACRSSGPDEESNHLVLSGNYFEGCGGRSIVALQGHGFSVVSGNAFGRLLPGAFGALCLKGGTGNVVSGNNFHNYGGDAAAPAIRAIGERGIGIQSNSFAIPEARQVWLDGVEDAVVNGNQFLGEIEGGDGHLHLDEVTGGSIVGNRFAGGVCPSIRLNHSLRDTPVLICANVFDEVAGCASPWEGNYDVETCTSSANGGNPEF